MTICTLTLFISICQADSEAIKRSTLKLIADNSGHVFIKGLKTPYTGKDSSYFANGLEFEQKTYKEGVLLKEFSWDKQGRKKQVKLFTASGSLKDYIIWNNNGQKQYEEYFSDDKKTGVIAGWNGQGNLLFEKHLANGVLNGAMSEWYDNGQKMLQENRVDGKRVGMILRWDKTGNSLPNK
jgi:antitoxin component YwqK of YwqJK toxin-antitoxin module